MLPNEPNFWSERFRQTLERYDEPLLRLVAGQLIKPRNQWPVDDLIERCVAVTGNAAVLDRRLEALDLPCRRLLAFMGHSRRLRWRLGSLLELLAAVGHADGPQPALTLFESGLLYPELPAATSRLTSFEQWLGQAAATSFAVLTHPLVAARALGFDLGLPSLDEDKETRRQGDKETSSFTVSPCHLVTLSPQEADGLDWPLRLSVLWQRVADAPLRRTQQGDFFKRDFERLRDDALLNGPGGGPAEVPEAGLLAVTLGQVFGIVHDRDGELRAAATPVISGEGWAGTLATLWTALLDVDTWDPLNGFRGDASPGNAYPSAYLLALLLLARLDEEAWADPASVERWLVEHHPFWSANAAGKPTGLTTFLLGLAYELRLVQAARLANGDWRVRLSPLGRWLLGVGEPPTPPPEFPQTLLVQPNLEIIAYRQGLTPELVGRLGRLAAWKSLSAACTLQLEPTTVYRALESGLSFEDMVSTLERRSTRALPSSVLESLRTWANKRDRLTVFPSAVLLEFASADDLNDALARGLPGLRLTERLAVVADESAIDFKHFRLIGTRDYSLPPERCVEIENDGVTLAVDAGRSDLLLECELPRFAELVERLGRNGRRCYQLTPASLGAARTSGFPLAALEMWFLQRAGRPLPAAARLLLTAAEQPAPQLKRYLVLEVADEDMADGLLQWPATRALIESRLGPTVLAVAEERAEELAAQLKALGVRLPERP